MIGPYLFGGSINAAFYAEMWHSSGEGLVHSSAKIVIFAIVMHSHFFYGMLPMPKLLNL
jgi:hypothetical protein